VTVVARQRSARWHWELFTANVAFAAATKSFTGKLSFVGRCKGSATVKAKKA
jgi:hypothetical protein